MFLENQHKVLVKLGGIVLYHFFVPMRALPRTYVFTYEHVSTVIFVCKHLEKKWLPDFLSFHPFRVTSAVWE